MTHAELDKKRLEPCMAEAYAKAQCPEPQVWPQGYDTWAKHGVWGFQYGDKKPVTLVPMELYYLSSDDLSKIVDKWCKGLRGWWYYTKKLDFHDKDYKKNVAELDKFRDFEAEVSKDTTLTYAQRAAKIKKEALAHNFMWRSRDKEYVRFNIFLGASPGGSKDAWEKNCYIYSIVKRLLETGVVKNTYIDYVHVRDFAYTDQTGEVFQAVMENISYWYDKGKLHKNTIEHETCNLYDGHGNYVKELWNHQDIRRYMTSVTFRDLSHTLFPEVIKAIKEDGRDDVAKWLEEKGHDENDYQFCISLWLMHKSWMDAHKENNQSGLI